MTWYRYPWMTPGHDRCYINLTPDEVEWCRSFWTFTLVEVPEAEVIIECDLLQRCIRVKPITLLWTRRL